MKSDRLILAVFVLGGSALNLVLRYLTFHYDSPVMNAYRFSVGTLCAVVCALVLFRREFFALLADARTMAALGAMSFLVFVVQLLYVEGLERVTTATVVMLCNTGIPLSIMISAWLFPDERGRVRSRRFRTGALAALGGSLALGIAESGSGSSSAAGIACLGAAVLIAAFNFAWLKKLVSSTHAPSLAVVMHGYVCAYFWGTALLRNAPVGRVAVTGFPFTMMVASGVLGFVVLSLVLNECVRRVGITVTRTIELAITPVVGVLGFVFLHEALGIPEILAGTAILAGSFIILSEKTPAPASI